MFVQFIMGQVRDAAAVRARMDEWSKTLQPGAEGWRATTAGTTDDGMFFAAVVFDSEEAARHNSDRPEQGEWWRETEPLIESPRFVDVRDAQALLHGVDPTAGFVQVIHARILDEELADSLVADMERGVSESRPDVTAILLGRHDGYATQVVYFTDEASAREGERSEAGGGPDMQEFARAFGDLMYLDLRDPWHYAR